MKKMHGFYIVAFLLLTTPLTALTIKLASPFPENSPWDITLKRMSAEWKEISDGQVDLRIYPGGVAGGEGDMVRKMRFGQLDAAVLSIFGMKSIVPNTFVMALPGVIQSEDELDYIIEEFAPSFDKDFIDQGFRNLVWSKSGWAHFFSKNLSRTPELMGKERLVVSNADEEFAANFKFLGFNVVPMSINEVIGALQSGMASALYGPPMAVAAYQWFAKVPYMLDFKLAPVLGGIVIRERQWQRIPERFHEDFKAAIASVSRDFYLESERLNAEAMTLMENHGLKIGELSESETMEWYQMLKGGHSLVIGEGKWVDEKIYSNFTAILEEIRSEAVESDF